MVYFSFEKHKNQIQKTLLSLGTLLFSLLIYGQGIKNDDFLSLEGWEYDGTTPVINNGTAHIQAGRATNIWQRVNLPRGEYVLTANVKSTSSEGTCYLYGKGSGFSKSTTAVPISITGTQITVRGIYNNDGTVEIGLYNDGQHDVTLDDISIDQEHCSPYYFFQGGDITELNYVIDNGGIFSDENGYALFSNDMQQEAKAQAVIKFLKKRGINTIRIRLSNHPGKDHPDNSQTYFLPDGYQDKKDCLKLAKWAKNAGLKIQFTFNYSDFWSNGENQTMPQEWNEAIKGMTDRNEIVKKITELVRDYTRKVMTDLSEIGVYPEFVSLGNEINGGLLFPYGYSYDVSETEATTDMPAGMANWSAIASFINAGYEEVKSVSPESKIIIHLADQTHDLVKFGDTVDYYVYSWFFDNLEKYGAKYDIIGASYYPSWSQVTVNSLVDYCNHLLDRYKKDILIMESGYNWNATRKDGYAGQLNHNAEEYVSTYPETPVGQKGYLTELVNGLKRVGLGTSNQCLGFLYWDPIMIHVEDPFGNNLTGWAHSVKWGKADVNVVENTTLFNFNGTALPALDVYTYNQNAEAEAPYHTQLEENETQETLSIHASKNNIYIQSYGENEVRIHSLLGIGKRIYMHADENCNITLPTGIYIINGKKQIVY